MRLAVTAGLIMTSIYLASASVFCDSDEGAILWIIASVLAVASLAVIAKGGK